MNEAKNKAIFVCMTTPVFPMGGFYGQQDYSLGKREGYVETLRAKVEELGLPWEVIEDTSRGDITEIEKENPKLLICVNGLQKRFFHGDFPKENIIYLTSLEMHSLDVKRVIRVMEEKQ